MLVLVWKHFWYSACPAKICFAAACDLTSLRCLLLTRMSNDVSSRNIAKSTSDDCELCGLVDSANSANTNTIKKTESLLTMNRRPDTDA
mmetsp:Transcript_49129/g.129643  ORF Transcript_49129/g.129643 Transcript_49129/m.129643 type:complete len:89 (-) Transcript_49129:41-307(-)